MYFCSAALAAWWHQKYNLAVYFVAIAALLGKFSNRFFIGLTLMALRNCRLAICRSNRSTTLLRHGGSAKENQKISHLDSNIRRNNSHPNDIDRFVIFRSGCHRTSQSHLVQRFYVARTQFVRNGTAVLLLHQWFPELQCYMVACTHHTDNAPVGILFRTS